MEVAARSHEVDLNAEAVQILVEMVEAVAVVALKVFSGPLPMKIPWQCSSKKLMIVWHVPIVIVSLERLKPNDTSPTAKQRQRI